MTMEITVRSSGGTQFHDLTDRVQECVRKAGKWDGVAVIFGKHTTVSIVVADDEEGLKKDFRDALARLVPGEGEYRHNSPGDRNAHAHIRSMLCGSSASIPFSDGKLQLGTWQRVFLVDFDDKSRDLRVDVTIVPC